MSLFKKIFVYKYFYRKKMQYSNLLKEEIKNFWNENSCGESLYLSESSTFGYMSH